MTLVWLAYVKFAVSFVAYSYYLQRLERERERATHLGNCLHTPASRNYPHGRLRRPEEYDAEYIKRMQREARAKSQWPSDRVGYPERDTRYVLHVQIEEWMWMSPI